MTQDDLDRLVLLRQQTKTGDAKRIREAAKVSQFEIGQVVGVPPSTISVWENGHRVPRGGTALKYARALDAIERATLTPS